MSVLKHFGNLKNIDTNFNLSVYLKRIEQKVEGYIDYVYGKDSRNSFSSMSESDKVYDRIYNNVRSHIGSYASKPQLAISGVTQIFQEVFEGHTYLNGVKMDESKGRILKTDIIRYINAYTSFLSLFSFYPSNDMYDKIDGIEMKNIDIPKVREFKLTYIQKLLNLESQEKLLEYISDPMFDYVPLKLDYDKNYVMYELFIDANKRITYSNFYNSYIMDVFHVKEKLNEYVIYKLSDYEVSLTDYFNGELKEYMAKEEYEKVITVYVGAFEKEYNKDLLVEIKNDPTLTRYMMEIAIDKHVENEKEYYTESCISNCRLSDVMNDIESTKQKK